MNIMIIAILLSFVLWAIFVSYLFLDEINKKIGKRRKVNVFVQGKKLEAQDYSFTPNFNDIDRHGNNLIYRLYVSLDGQVSDVLTNPRSFKEIKEGDILEAWIYTGYFGRTHIELI